ncbi:MarR family transcriptional regulator [Enterovibrio norvegicus]|uniref:DNA-binding transcriptional regulator, MarR family n=2 Tax=Enterovibrio norvegicus TaxID=188144 RepID=A0A1I5S5A7_9GAMM|nr:MarR family transcriptional regulator [Enterovibrio norvegicus]MCC4800959.1 MarR family transcriptional regulator [Enterovibrio norvegicus]OEE68945.1 MarR family transcriptional regulator [Enterovibrio norvegicus]OEF51322.1 MarR family transcriptional regulator [Enterovibrio norvegicus]OEF58576.1 MarR family transcriptional regulator [Enterovibrio norvegicus]PMH71951.1 MarR family transcriptional regulator [Enterovibrio norvegicus]
MSEFDRQASFGWLINVVAGKAEKRLDAELKQHGLTVALWPTMMCLWEEEGVTQRQIALKAKVENSTTTRTLDKLEKLGLVERRDDPDSRRNYRIYLTESGKALRDKVAAIPLAINAELLTTLNDDEHSQLIHLLQKVVANVEL